MGLLSLLGKREGKSCERLCGIRDWPEGRALMAGTTAATFATLCPKGFMFKVCSLSPANPKPKKLTRRYFVAHLLAKPYLKES